MSASMLYRPMVNNLLAADLRKCSNLYLPEHWLHEEWSSVTEIIIDSSVITMYKVFLNISIHVQWVLGIIYLTEDVGSPTYV